MRGTRLFRQVACLLSQFVPNELLCHFGRRFIVMVSRFGRRYDYLTPHGQRNTRYRSITHANAYAIIKFTAANSTNTNPTV